MPAMIGDLIVLAALALVVGLAIRSLFKARKSGGSCGGDCSRCGSCCQNKQQT